ncbi:T9SS C-terminal target domain-containing protein [candidate division KSB1 bacterium]|nr:T9SS type A sorting domain-containing protein [candidate division KSB1 bacterium]RQV99877.1 MAG: T9SS C-terminal target domain-containing protein [candidate division KSB1 bacterium]
MHKSLLQFFVVVIISFFLSGNITAQVKPDSLEIAADDSISIEMVLVPQDSLQDEKQPPAKNKIAEPSTGPKRSPVSSDDKAAPGAPMNLRVNGTNPSPWQNTPQFAVTWESPADSSGIAKTWYKLGAKPAHNADTTGSAIGALPLNLLMTHQDGENLYIWLQDSAGNTDFRAFASAILRYDARPPVIDSLVLTTPQPTFFQNDVSWINPKDQSAGSSLWVYFQEQHPAAVRLDAELFESKSIAPDADDDSVEFVLQLSEFPKDLLTFDITLFDSAGNTATESITIGLDRTSPTNTLAQSPDTTMPGPFMVSWDIGRVTEDGAGLGGFFDVRVKVDDGEWQVWQTHYQGTSLFYDGNDGHSYAFEIAAYDNVGNREDFSEIAETVTTVVTKFEDITPPESPTNATINGSPAQQWSNDSEFVLDWDSPDDPSGISKIYYKFYEPPTSPDDFVGSDIGTPPVRLEFIDVGETAVYFWLEDGAGNSDFRNYATSRIKHDSSPPRLDSLSIKNAVYDDLWINPDSVANAHIRLVYTEYYPDSLRLYFNNNMISEKQGALLPGEEQEIDLFFPLDNIDDGCYPVTALLSDSAGNVAADSLLLCLDRTPPSGATATAPTQSLSNEITITWTDESAGTDEGSGLSGEYDLRMRTADGEWYELLKRMPATSYTYTSAPQDRLEFEVAAWDNAGNREVFTGIPEAITEIDTFFVDQTPPPGPIDVAVRGNLPNVWQNEAEFALEWQNPYDPSGIQKAYYKFNSPPTFAADYTDSVAVQDSLGTLSLQATEEDGQVVYVWLQDGQGNADYTTATTALLRYDATKPLISSIQAVDSISMENRYNQLIRPEITLSVAFQEKHADSLFLFSDSLGQKKIKLSERNTFADTARVTFNIANAEDGSYWLYAALSDSAGQVSNVDSTEIFLDSQPPLISHTPPDTVVMAGTPIPIQATVSETNPLKYVDLWYWQGGEHLRQSIAMTWISDSTYEAEIPGAAAGARGIEYLIVAHDGVNENRFPLTEQNKKALSIRVQLDDGIAMPSPLMAGSDENAYRLVSFPLVLQQPTGAALLENKLGTYDPTQWRFLRWNPVDLLFIEYPDIKEIQQGCAYWIKTTNQNVILETNAGITTSTTKPNKLVLKKGWNDIGVPFNFPVAWNDIVAASAIDTQKVQGPHTYIGRWQYPFENTILYPWVGYSIYSDVDDISIIIPALEAQLPRFAEEPFVSHSDLLWAFEIKAKSNEMIDAANYFGCVKSATDVWDYGLDFLEAPEIGSYVSLYFEHNDWAPNFSRFTSDFRPAKKGQVWDFQIVSNKTDHTVRLSFRALKELPKSLQVKLVDKEASVDLDLANDSTYAFQFSKNEDIRNFTIVAGDAEFMQTQADEFENVPKQTEPVRNYPNPFNSSTVISYELHKGTIVDLAIYNLLAQKVRQLRSGYQEKGFYQVSWDAHDDNGGVLGTGVYIIRLETPEFTHTRKMVYMR